MTPIPYGELDTVAGQTRRTLVLRALLGAAAIGAAVAVVLVGRGEAAPPSPLPSGTDGLVVLDLSASISAQSYLRVEKAIQGLTSNEQKVGLVVFSDTAYEMLPPGSPSRELRRLLRLFKPIGGSGADVVFPANPWADDFRAGTRISAGLRAARESLAREGVEKGSILLVSDLDSPATDVARLGAEVDDLRRLGIDLRVVPIFPIKEKQALFESLVGRGRIAKTTTANAPVRAPEGVGVRGALPWTFVLIALALTALLAVNERLNARLLR